MKLKDELLIVMGLVILLVIVIIFSQSVILRIILGLPFLLFFPGYTLIAAISPRRDSLKPIERISISFGVSLIVSVLIGFALDYSPWGVQLYPVLVSLGIFIFVTGFVALFRQRGRVEEGCAVSFTLNLRAWRQKALLDKLLIGVVAVSVLAVAGAVTYAFVVPMEERFTEFYVLGPDGKIGDYPENLIVGQEANVVIGVVNHEYEVVNYQLEVIADGTRLTEPTRIVLGHDEKWERTVSFIPQKTGEQRLEFELYQDGQPYRRIYLMVDVEES